ncbi:hypothetical protein D3C84_1227080 [compost metagenome]
MGDFADEIQPHSGRFGILPAPFTRKVRVEYPADIFGLYPDAFIAYMEHNLFSLILSNEVYAFA